MTRTCTYVNTKCKKMYRDFLIKTNTMYSLEAKLLQMYTTETKLSEY